MTYSLPPIVKLAERLLKEVECAVRHFPRFHKYQCGAELRKSAMQVARLSHRAWWDQDNKANWVGRLKWAVDDLKINLQLASAVKAFHSFAQFEHLIRIARELGKQAGGWYRQHHPKGRNAGADAPPQRAQILSARAASHAEAKL